MLIASIGPTLLTAVILGAACLFVYAYRSQKTCPYCGYRHNRRKSRFPVCKKCGRNRVTGGAGEAVR